MRTDLNMNSLENLCLVTWYRPPNSAVEKFASFETRIGHLDSENIEYYVMGDTNCNTNSVCDNNSRPLSYLADIYGLQQLINTRTRIAEVTSTLLYFIAVKHT